MRNETNLERILLLVLFSLAPIVFAILGMYVISDLTHVLDPSRNGVMILVVGIFGFAFGVLLFWRTTEILALEEVMQ